MRVLHRRQLALLLRPSPKSTESSACDERLHLAGRLGRAGFVTERQQRALLRLTAIGCATAIFTVALVGWHFSRLLLPLAVTCYGCALAIAMLLRMYAQRLERSLLHELPLFLESLTLLVESGVSLLSAIEQLIETPPRSEGRRYLYLLLRSARRENDAGVAFSAALRALAASVPFPSAQHVLFHLDLGMSEGVSSARSLRALADYSHAEWHISVTTRVRRLETFVVFPVFTAVIGLLLLIGSGPLLTLLERDTPMFIQSETLPHEE